MSLRGVTSTRVAKRGQRPTIFPVPCNRLETESFPLVTQEFTGVVRQCSQNAHPRGCYRRCTLFVANYFPLREFRCRFITIVCTCCPCLQIIAVLAGFQRYTDLSLRTSRGRTREIGLSSQVR
jgi:hypothetical protein